MPPHVADKLLNHTQGTLKGVALIYQKGTFLPERAAARELWASHVRTCAEPSQAIAALVSPCGAGRGAGEAQEQDSGRRLGPERTNVLRPNLTRRRCM